MSGADETYRHWLELRLGQSFVDELMSPDQAVAWHELCRTLRVGPRPVADDAAEPELDEDSMSLETCLVGPDGRNISPLWAIGSTRAGGCTVVQDLLLGLCGPAGGPARTRLGDALPVPLVVCGRTVRGPLGMLGMDVRWDSCESVAEALQRWWSLVEHDVRRGFEPGFVAAGLQARRERPLLLICGLDELPPATRAAVGGWAAELCAAGAPVLLTTRSADVPELEALRVGGSLRRVYLQTLSRPAIGRFVERWVRLPGDFEPALVERVRAAIDASPALLALARRPVTLASLTVLLARTDVAPDSLEGLQRQLLAVLDPQRPAHRLLMARIVADRDSPIPAAERAEWLAPLVAAAGLHDHPALGDALGRDPALAEAGEAVLRAAAQSWASGGCPIAAVRAEMPARLAAVEGAVDDVDDAMARLLVFGRRAGWWRPEHAFVLHRGLPGRERLFDTLPGAIRPRPLFVALAELQEMWGTFALPLLRAAPLGYLLAEGGAACPVTTAALFAETPPPEVRAVRDLFQRALLLELALVSLAADDEVLQREVLEVVLARDQDLDAALDRALLAELGETRPPGPRSAGHLSPRLLHIDAALELASRLTPDGASELARDLELARARAATEPEHGPRLQRLAAFVVVILLYAIDRRLVPARVEIRRNDVQALLAALTRPEAVAAAFPEERRGQLAVDWQWVARQSWAPQRVAEILLLHMPDAVSLAPEQVLPRCHAWLRRFLGDSEPAVVLSRARSGR
ncbi:hypothetical protein [Nannocystis radixulma]|uniref:NACHT domain-containing protein n=1 Tax=Nannocystis radixulma TaxID=2995305 RepID=A0ABT5AXE4_9BACT|nr:hypothetical protein [Nannocystis radixulma]MDC0666153.1 hypothetical protein [Nannocystis radixulma]